jgi:hypothetical protein
MKEINVTIPYKYSAREYQKPFWVAMNIKKLLRAVLVWHRRSGKDKTLVNFVAAKSRGLLLHIPHLQSGKKDSLGRRG